MNTLKNNHQNRHGHFAALLVLLLATNSFYAKALDVIDPNGWDYSNISDSSEYNGSYSAANLFDQDLTGVALGTILSGNEYATASQSSAFIAFQLDAIYTNVGSIFYAQRNGYYADQDKMGIISIWSSDTTPFSAADPGTPPDSVVAITNSTGAQWTEYLMTNTISGQYFLLKLAQTVVGGNPGGNELRLGAVLGQPPSITFAPADKTVYAGGTARLSTTAGGTGPLAYVWVHGSSTLTNGDRISGADTGNLVISNVVAGDAGAYTLTISNAYGTTNISAALTVVEMPTNAAEAAVIAAKPRAFWQLNESPGATTALDLVGSFNGTYGGSSGIGVAGPQAPLYPGFSATNTALQTYSFTIDSVVTVPAMNIAASNSVTLLAWIYQDGAAGSQQPYTGIVYCRGGSGQTSAGLICSSDGTKLGYQWAGNRYNFDSGLVLPTNQWTLVALVYTPSATMLYCGSSNGIVLSASDNYANPGQTFEVPVKIGVDTDVGESLRTFNGMIDDVAFFNRALSESEIDAIYEAGTGIVPSLQIVSQTATNVYVFQGQPIHLSVQVSGVNPVYQWYKASAPIPSGTNSSFSIASAKIGDAGGYYVVVTNDVNSATSAVFSVTVPSFVVLPIGVSGSIYTNISSSSDFSDPDYAGANLFDSDLTGVSIGARLTGRDWADNGNNLGLQPAYVAFELDKVYQASAVLYAQRNSQPGQTIDKITGLSIWASDTTPFSASDPGTTPDAVVSIPDIDAAVLHAYLLPATISGKYFVIKVEQNPTVDGSNIGGNEFRLAAEVTPVPLTYSVSPSGISLNWPAGATLQQADDVAGPWSNATGVTSGLPISTTAVKKFYRILY